VLLGLDAPDDAAVYRIDDKTAIVQTVDFFTPVVDDPYDWGAIAVANAVSDIYAMGAKPIVGLNLVAWPKDLDLDFLAEVLRGGADKALEAGVSIVGGHTVEDPEPKYGMAVTGIVDPGSFITMGGALAGMSIVLTKPLGSGIISTALKRGEAGESLVKETTAVMSALNAGAAAAMIEVGANGVTDVTGFGLLGHLQRMSAASGVSAEIWAADVPVIDGVAELAERDFVPGGSRRNESFFGPLVGFDAEVDAVTRTILFDAQTSGGLMIAVDDRDVEALLGALERNNTLARSVIGRFTEEEAGTIRVRRARGARGGSSPPTGRLARARSCEPPEVR